MDRCGSLIAVLVMVVLLFSGSATAIDINSSKSFQYYSGGDLDFEVDQSGYVTLQGDMDLQNQYRLNNFFAQGTGTGSGQCEDGEFVQYVNADGSYVCANAAASAGNTYVNETGDTMTGALNMSGNNLNNIGTLNSQGNGLSIGGNVDLGSNGLSTDWLTVTNALADGNISEDLTISAGGSVDPDALNRLLNDEDIRNDTTINADGFVNSSALETRIAGNQLVFSSGGVLAVSEGSGSGLDADTLDGWNTSELDWTHLALEQTDITVADLGAADANLDMDGVNRIINLQNPQNAQDAATKDYVDTTANAYDNQTLAEVLTAGNDAAGQNIVNVGVLSLNTKLSDENISESITIGSSGTVNPNAIQSSIAGTALAQGEGGTLSVSPGWGLATDGTTDTINLSDGVAGTGLNFNQGALDVEYGSSDGTAAEGSNTLTVAAGTGLTASDDTLNIGTDGDSIALNLDTDSDQTISADQWVFNNNLTVQGNLDVWGNVTNTDVQNLNVNGSLLPPQDYSGQFNVGESGRAWQHATFTGDINVDGTVDGIDLSETGDGVAINGNVYEIDADGSTLNVNGGQVQVADSGITGTQIASSAAGDGLSGGNGNALSVNTANGVETANGNVQLTGAYQSGSAYENEFVNQSGDTMEGDLSLNGQHRITNVPAPSTDGDIVNKSYVDSAATDANTDNQDLENVLSQGSDAGNNDINMTGNDVDLRGGSVTSSQGEVCIGDQCA